MKRSIIRCRVRAISTRSGQVFTYPFNRRYPMYSSFHYIIRVRHYTQVSIRHSIKEGGRAIVCGMKPFNYGVHILYRSGPIFVRICVLSMYFRTSELFSSIYNRSSKVIRRRQLIKYIQVSNRFRGGVRTIIHLCPCVLRVITFTPIRVSTRANFFATYRRSLTSRRELIVTIVSRRLFNYKTCYNRCHVREGYISQRARPVIKIVQVIFIRPIAQRRIRRCGRWCRWQDNWFFRFVGCW